MRVGVLEGFERGVVGGVDVGSSVERMRYIEGGPGVWGTANCVVKTVWL